VEEKEDNKENENNNTFLLKSLPLSKKVVFNVDDFHELVTIVT